MAVAIAGGVIATAVLAYQAATQANNRAGSAGPVQLPTGVATNFYGTNNTYYDAGKTTVNVYRAPNFGALANAEVLRTYLYDDIAQASAVFCLARSGPSSLDARPTYINLTSSGTAYGTNYDYRRVNTPEAFRALLQASTSASGIFSAYTNVNSAAQQNLSIYVIRPTENPAQLEIQAVYEMDLVSTTNPAGTYASVRRYQNGQCGPFYDVFYPSNSETNTPFSPTVVSFDRSAGGVSTYRVAAGRPFYFVWWPDPGVPNLGSAEAPLTTIGSGDVRAAYSTMLGRTSLFMVLPMFPSL